MPWNIITTDKDGSVNLGSGTTVSPKGEVLAYYHEKRVGVRIYMMLLL